MSDLGAAGSSPELAVVIPTRDRRVVLTEMLSRLKRYAGSAPIELIVVDDGSTDGSAAAARQIGLPRSWSTRVLEHAPAGPAAARNRGIREAAAPVCLFLGDDSFPTPSLIEGHLRFHRTRPVAEEAMLGLVCPAPPLDASALQRWLHEDGAQFGYAQLESGDRVHPANFWTSNVSVKRELLLRAGGFDEGFADAACEDAELGLRLARLGMQLSFDAGAVALHYHPTDLARTLERMARIGIAYRRLVQLAPEMPAPRRPGGRHHLKAAALTVALRAAPSSRVRRASWRFVCDEAMREAFWGGLPANAAPRIGRRLTRAVLDHHSASPPQPRTPAGDYDGTKD